MAGFSLGFQLLKTAFQTGQAPPLLVKLLRARLALPEPGDDLLGFPDPGRQVRDLQGKQSTQARDLTLELDVHRVELTRGDRKADQILGFEPVGRFALFEIPVESALDPAEQHGILQQHLVLFGRYRHPRLVSHTSVLVRVQGEISEKVGPFALSSPTVAHLQGGGKSTNALPPCASPRVVG